MKRLHLMLMAALVLSFCASSQAAPQEETVKLSGGKITMPAPEGWKREEVRSRIIEAEFSIPKVEGDADDGRVTFMAAGGGPEANIERWKNQFSPGKGADKLKSDVEKIKVGDADVYMVDIQGVFKSQPRGPLGPTETLSGYRMLGAIVVLKNGGEYYVKVTGPKKTVAANVEAFQAMIKGMKAK